MLPICIFAGCVGPMMLLFATPGRRGDSVLVDSGGGGVLANDFFLPALQAEIYGDLSLK